MVGSRVYVGGLPYGVRERDLERFFKGYGRTRDIMIKNGYGFVEFEDHRDADDAVYDLNGKELMSDKYAKKVVVEPARGQAHGSGGRFDDRGGGRGGSGGGRVSGIGDRYYGPAFSTEFRLFVKNLSSRVNWKDLKDYMRQAGDVTYADAHKQHRNEGVVEFATLSDMKSALEKLNDTELYGRRIRLVEDKPKSGRGRRNDRSRSTNSRTRSRSPQRKSNKSRSFNSKSRSPAKDSRSRSNSSRRDAKSSRSQSPDEQRKRSPRSGSPKACIAERRSRSKSIEPSKALDRSRSPSKLIDASPSKSETQPSAVELEIRTAPPKIVEAENMGLIEHNQLAEGQSEDKSNRSRSRSVGSSTKGRSRSRSRSVLLDKDSANGSPPYNGATSLGSLGF